MPIVWGQYYSRYNSRDVTEVCIRNLHFSEGRNDWNKTKIKKTGDIQFPVMQIHTHCISEHGHEMQNVRRTYPM